MKRYRVSKWKLSMYETEFHYIDAKNGKEAIKLVRAQHGPGNWTATAWSEP